MIQPCILTYTLYFFLLCSSVCMYFNHKQDRVFVLEWIKTERNTNLTQHVTATGADRCEYVVTGRDRGGLGIRQP